MGTFFGAGRERTTVEHGAARFELPIHYYRDDMFGLFFTAELDALKEEMPSDRLHPVVVAPGRGVVAIIAFNYIDTSIGPYGEVGVVVPAVHGDRPAPPILPLALEAGWPGFGAVVLHLPVTGTLPRDAGRGQWGYTKFVGDMRFLVSPEVLQCRLSEGDAHILTMRVTRGGLLSTDERPMVTYSVKAGDLIRTEIPARSSLRWSPLCRDCSLELGDHRVADHIRQLGISTTPLLKRYYVERSGILPAGTVIESGVRPLDGYRGEDREGKHEVSFIGAAR